MAGWRNHILSSGLARYMPDAPTHAGAYRLVSHIASGGMGIVYLAEREDGGEPARAAVKLIRRGIDEDQVRRFEAERQILASLQHPNIARLIDAGVTGDHRPYLVMEYVAGLPIDRYCDQHRLSIRHRVALLRNVARAVAHAHHNLVVHRDLKPSNIFVTHIGVVKLLDFGIAKLVDLDPDRTTQMTGPGLRLMTPAYASPEQVTGATITTATDVYVLGVLLFELLTGRRAQETDNRSIPDIERVVVRTEIARPSEIVEAGENPATAQAAADARSTTPAKLRRQLRGDLDRIVAVATRKDPARRYPSADALAADLDRYLLGQPILARDESAIYRIGKFVRRRWPVVAAAIVFLALLAAYAVTVTIQARQVAAERDRARDAQAAAEAVSDYLIEMFQASDPGATRGDTITARELLATGVSRIQTLDGQPEAQARLQDVIGQVYESLGKFDQARPLLEASLATRRRLFGDGHAAVGDSLTHLGDLLILQGRYPEAEKAAREALAIHRATAGPESAEAAEDLGLIGAALASRGERAEAKAVLDQALAIRRRVLPPDDPAIAENLSALAFVASGAGNFAEMEVRHAEALAILRRAFGNKHPRVALGLNNLAVAYDSRGRYDEAERLHREALQMRRELFGNTHPAVATSLNNLSTVLQKQQRFAEAEPLAREVLALRRTLLGPDHPNTITACNNLGVLLTRSGRAQEAESILREGVAAARSRLPEDHQTALQVQMSLAAAIARLGKDAEADALFVRVHDLRVRSLGPEHPDVASGLHARGQFFADRKRWSEAEPLVAQAYALRVKVLGAAHPETQRTARTLESIYRATGKVAEARALSVAQR
jgi:serine/threonine protein kinase/Tfp pilus assembly protein PilF